MAYRLVVRVDAMLSYVAHLFARSAWVVERQRCPEVLDVRSCEPVACRVSHLYVWKAHAARLAQRGGLDALHPALLPVRRRGVSPRVLQAGPAYRAEHPGLVSGAATWTVPAWARRVATG